MSQRSIINVSPFRTNVLDIIGVPLIDSQGRSVVVSQVGTEFVIRIDGQEDSRAAGNLGASYRLNMLEVSRA